MYDTKCDRNPPSCCFFLTDLIVVVVAGGGDPDQVEQLAEPPRRRRRRSHGRSEAVRLVGGHMYSVYCFYGTVRNQMNIKFHQQETHPAIALVDQPPRPPLLNVDVDLPADG